MNVLNIRPANFAWEQPICCSVDTYEMKRQRATSLLEKQREIQKKIDEDKLYKLHLLDFGGQGWGIK